MSDKFIARGIKLDILLQRLIDQAIASGRVVSMKALVTVLVEDYQEELKRFIYELESGFVDYGNVGIPTTTPLARRQHAYAEVWVRQAIENFPYARLPGDIQGELNLRYVMAQPHRFANIPWDCKSPDVVIAAIKADGLNLFHVPHKMQTSTLVTIAVTDNGLALEAVAPDLKSEAVCMAAVANNGNALKDVPKDLCSCHVCMTAIHRNGEALRYVPADLHSTALHAAAIKQTPYAIRHVPKEALTEALCLASVKKAGGALGMIPKEFRSAKVCAEAVKKSISAIDFVPPEVRKSHDFQQSLIDLSGDRDAFAFAADFVRNSPGDGQ